MLHCQPLATTCDTRLVPIKKAQPSQDSTLGLTLLRIVFTR